MNEVYALEAEGCTSFAEVKLALSQFYPYQGRFISEVPKGWPAKVLEAARNLSDSDQKKISRFLEKIVSSGVLVSPKFSSYSPAKSLKENFNSLLNTEDLAAALLWDESACDGAKFRYILDELPEASGAPVPMTVKDYIKILHPILRASREIFVVDPYLNPCRAEYGRFVEVLFDAASKYGATNFVFISQYNSERGDLPLDMEKVRLHLIRAQKEASGHHAVRCEFHNWDKGDLDQHGRYFFSIKYGLSFDRGFRVQETKRQQDALHGANVVSVLSVKNHDFLLKTYLDAKASYQSDGLVLR